MDVGGRRLFARTSLFFNTEDLVFQYYSYFLFLSIEVIRMANIDEMEVGRGVCGIKACDASRLNTANKR